MSSLLVADDSYPAIKRHLEQFREDLEQLFSWLSEGKIEPKVARRIGFDDVASTHALLEQGGLSGKIVLEPWA